MAENKKYKVLICLETIVESESTEQAERMASAAAVDFLPLSGGNSFDEDYAGYARPKFTLSAVSSVENY